MAQALIPLAPLPRVVQVSLTDLSSVMALEFGWPTIDGGLTLAMHTVDDTGNGVQASHDRTIFAVANDAERETFIAKVVARTSLARDVVAEAVSQAVDAVDIWLRTRQGSDAAPKQRDSQATRLVKLALDNNVELFHTPEGECYGTMEIDGHKEHWMLKVRGFRRWLSHLYYREFDTSPGSQALQDALETLAGKALYDGPEIPVYTRLALHENVIYIDVANAAWQAIAISAQGWQVIDTPPIKFRRTRGMLPLPLPVAGGTLQELRSFVNVVSDAAWYLVVSWLVAALRPEGPYPVLVIHGEEGSAKSSLLRVLRSLIDPNKALLRSTPRTEHDLVIAATNGWMIALDNMSHLPIWLSDSLCRLATGAGFGTRELYKQLP